MSVYSKLKSVETESYTGSGGVYSNFLREQIEKEKGLTPVTPVSFAQAERDSIYDPAVEKAMKQRDTRKTADYLMSQEPKPFVPVAPTQVKGVLGLGEGLLGVGKAGLGIASALGQQASDVKQPGQVNPLQAILGYKPDSKTYKLLDPAIEATQKEMERQESKAIQPQGIWGQRLKGVAESTPGMFAAIGAPSPASGAAFLGATSGGREFLEGLKQGTFPEALGSGAISGGAEATFSQVPLKFLDKPIKSFSKPVVNAGLNIVRQMASEGAEEWLTETASILGKQATYNRGKELTVNEVLAQANEAGISGALMGGILGGLSDTNSNISREYEATGKVTPEAIIKDAVEQGVMTQQEASAPEPLKALNVKLQQDVQQAQMPRVDTPQLTLPTDTFTEKQAGPTEAISAERPVTGKNITEDALKSQASVMLGELNQSQRGFKTGDPEGTGRTIYQNRVTNEIFIPLLDGTSGVLKSKATYKQIENALNRIIDGKTDSKMSTYLKEEMNKQLETGYKTMEGINAPPLSEPTDADWSDLATHLSRFPSIQAQQLIKDVEAGKLSIQEAMETQPEFPITTIEQRLAPKDVGPVAQSVYQQIKQAEPTISKAQAPTGEVSMTVTPQELAEMSDTVQELEGVAPPMMLVKYKKALDEMNRKGITKATKTEFKKLVEYRNELKDLKKQYTKDVKGAVKGAVKGFKQELRQKAQDKKDVKKLVDNIKKIRKGELTPMMKTIGESLTKDISTKNISAQMREALEATNEAIKNLQEQGQEIDTEMMSAIDEMNRKTPKDMAIEDVRELVQLTDQVIKMSSDEIKQLNKQRRKQEQDLKSGMSKDLSVKDDRMDTKTGRTKEIGGVENVASFFQGLKNTTPKNLFYELSNANKDGAFYKTFMTLRKAQNKYLTNTFTLEDIIAKYSEDFDTITKSAEWKNAQDVNGRQLSSGEKVWLKRAIENKNMRDSLEQKGYERDGVKYDITIDEINNIKLNEGEQKVFDMLEEYFDATYDMLNEAYLEKFHYELEKVDGYLTKRAVRDKAKVDAESMINDMMEGKVSVNTGSAIKRTGAVNTLLMEDIATVIKRQMQVASKYNAYLNPMQQVENTLFSNEVKNKLKRKYGTFKGVGIHEQLFRKLQKDMLGQRIDLGDANTWAGKVRSNVVSSIFGLNPAIIAKQFPSYFMASGTLSDASLRHGLATKAEIDEMIERSARARERVEVGAERDIAGLKGIKKKATAGIRKADVWVASRLWEATKYEVQQKNPSVEVGSEAYWDKVNDLFDDVLDSQPNFTPLERSDTMRQQGEMNKVLTAFGSAKNASVNEMRNAWIKGRKTGDWSLMKKKTKGFVQSQLLLALVNTLRAKLRDRDEGYLMALANSVMGSVQGLDIVNSIMRGFKPGSMSIDAVSDFFGDIEKFYRASKNAYQSLVDEEVEFDAERAKNSSVQLVESLSALFGVPTRNAKLLVQDVLSLPKLVGQPLPDLSFKFREAVDPYTNSEYYTLIATELEKDNPNLTNLLKNLDEVGASKRGLESSMLSKVRSGKLEQSDYDKLKDFFK